MSIDNIFIVGAGLMGGGIAQVCAQAGLEVTITEIYNYALLEIATSNVQL